MDQGDVPGVGQQAHDHRQGRVEVILEDHSRRLRKALADVDRQGAHVAVEDGGIGKRVVACQERDHLLAAGHHQVDPAAPVLLAQPAAEAVDEPGKRLVSGTPWYSASGRGLLDGLTKPVGH